MKITANLILAASIFCLAACSETAKNNNAETANLEDISAVPGPDLAPMTMSDGTNTTPTTAPANAGGPLNPPHGEPGHDCAVPVGQPLSGGGSSAPASTPNPVLPPNTEMSVITNQTVPGSNAPVAAGMNPAHGEPGHDCAIPVGAPLKK